MPAPATIDEFLDVVRRSGQVDARGLEAYLRQRRQANTLPADPRMLAGLLVRDGMLTAFQAEQFLQGKHKGFTLGGYRILERIGAGGMGAVFLAEHEVMKRRVALKMLPAQFAADPAALARFHREAQAAAALVHPNIVHAYDFRHEAGVHFLVMEYVPGPSLQTVLDGGPLPVGLACEYVRQAAIGLQHAHDAGLVHRDVKPANLLVDPEGTVKLLDLGLARYVPAGQPSVTRQFDENLVMGTADYLSPEQAINLHEADARSDVYSLGVTLYALLTGQPPFSEGSITQKLLWHQMKDPRPLRQVRPEVPAEVEAVAMAMMAKDPASRMASCAEVALALEPFCTPTTSQPLGLTTAGGSGPLARRSGPHPGRSGKRGKQPGLDVRLPPGKRGGSWVPLLLLSGAMLLLLSLAGGILALVMMAPATAETERPLPPEGARPVHVFQLPDQQGELFALLVGKSSSRLVAFHPAGQVVWMAGSTSAIQCWDLETRQQAFTLSGHAGGVVALCPSRNGSRMLSAGADRVLHLWPGRNPGKSRQLAKLPSRPWCAAWSPDERQVLAGGDDGISTVTDSATGRILRRVPGHKGAVRAIACLPTGPRHAITGGIDGTARVWAIDTGATVRKLSHVHAGGCLAVACTTKLMATAGQDGFVCVWHVTDGKLAHRFDKAHGPLRDLAFSPDGSRLLAACEDRHVYLYDIGAKRLLRLFAGHQGGVTSVAFSSDGKHFASGGDDGSVVLWGLPK